jgi:hypothetical protein
MIEGLTAAAFTAQLHTTFRIHYGPQAALDAELIDVDEREPTPRQIRFSVLLRGPREPILPQGLYRIEHAVLGTHELFTGPCEVDETSTYYALTFNYRLPLAR